MVFKHRVRASEMESSKRANMQNSNLLPVKAKGEVRLRSVLSFGNGGNVSTPTVRNFWPTDSPFLPIGDLFENRRQFRSPMKMEIMAGGASLAPKRKICCPGWKRSRRMQLGVECLSTAEIRAASMTEELFVLMRRVAGLEQVETVIGGHNDQLLCLPDPFTPANKGFFIKQTHETAMVCSATFCRVSITEIGCDRRAMFSRGVDRRHFELGGRHFVMFGFGWNAHFPKFGIQIAHELRNAVFDGAKILIFQFLAFRRWRAKKRATGGD